MVTEKQLSHQGSFTPGVLILIVLDYGHWVICLPRKQRWVKVLILIVLDYGHWGGKGMPLGKPSSVLILIVLDYGHWVKKESDLYWGQLQVLILIVLDYGHWVRFHLRKWRACQSLNPYCVGLWSLSQIIWTFFDIRRKVLILIVLDYGHWECSLRGL